MKIVAILCLSSLVAGGAIGYAVAYGTKVEMGSEIIVRTEPRAVKSGGEDPELAGLRAQVAELKRKLASAARAEPGPSAVAAPSRQVSQESAKQADEPRSAGPDRFRGGLERLAKEDPEKYAQITNRMAQFRQRRMAQAASRLDFLASIETSGMSEEARQTHGELQNLIVKREELDERMRDASLSESERREVFEEVRETERQLREVSAAERDTLLTMLAESFGFTGNDARALSESTKEIFDATSRAPAMVPPPPPPAD